MNTSEIIKEISKRTGLPEDKVRRSVFDFSRDCSFIVTSKATGGFMMPHMGYLAISTDVLLFDLKRILNDLEKKLKKNYKLLQSGKTKYRRIFTKRVDEFYAVVTLILENQNLRNGKYKKGAGKKKPVDISNLKEYIDRMDIILDTLPTTLQREKHSEIQKICMQRLHEQGLLQFNTVKDCEMQPMSLCIGS